MPNLYRLRTNLAMKDGTVYPSGTIQSLSLSGKDEAKLISVGALTILQTPPLSALPNWEKRAERLEKHGIVTITDLLQADQAELAKQMKVKEETIAAWQRAVLQWTRVQD